MAISTYSELKTAVANWLNRGDLTARIPEFIAVSEALMSRSLRLRQMTQRDTAGVDAAYAQPPADFLEEIKLTAMDGGESWDIAPMPPEALAQMAHGAETGRPRFYALVGPEFRFYPVPDKAYTVELTYYQAIPALSDAAPSNWMLVQAPDAYLYGALLQAAPYLRDNEQMGIWSAGFAGALDGLRAAQRTKGGALRVESELASSAFNIITG